MGIHILHCFPGRISIPLTASHLTCDDVRPCCPLNVAEQAHMWICSWPLYSGGKMLRQSWCCDPKEKHVVWNRQRIRLKNRHGTILLLCVCVCMFVYMRRSWPLSLSPPAVINLSHPPHTTHIHTHTMYFSGTGVVGH